MSHTTQNKAQNKPQLPDGVYGITAEKFSRGRSNIEVVQEMIAGGIRIIQYREKRPPKSFAVMLEECRAIRALTREAGVLFIINDYPALALLVGADGVHVGQDDLPVAAVRELVGPNKIIGLSTHAPEEARAAVAAGADYIGVGPIFSTQTKEDVTDPVGFAYIDHVKEHCPLPFTVLGGIKEHNLAQVIARGAKSACLVTEIVEADNICAKVQRLQAMFPKF